MSDGGTPVRTDTTVVSVPVTRNLAKPIFDPMTYSLRGLETLPLGTVVATVSAQDRDQRVSAHDGTASVHLRILIQGGSAHDGTALDISI